MSAGGDSETGAAAGGMRRVRCFVSGRVQGVWFRAGAAERARALGLHGFVRNRNDGRVELLLAGDGRAVDEMLVWLWRGPERARVTGVAVEEAYEAVPSGGFDVRETL